MRMMEAIDVLEENQNDPVVIALHINLGNLYCKFEQWEVFTMFSDETNQLEHIFNTVVVLFLGNCYDWNA